ncbi:uncharacterized protein LOC143975818 [Lithobates pipiens]
MAVLSTSRDFRNMELQNSFSSKKSPVHFVEGRHLSIADVFNILTEMSSTLNESGKKMLETLKNMKPHSFEHIRQEFPVHRLQHVTDMSSMEGIYDEERFKTTMRAIRPQFRDLVFWSAEIAPEDIREARKESFKEAKEVLPSWMARKYGKKIKDQFANSPAFDKSSRYGNFKFSFHFFDLLSLYQTQHCGGEKPQLRILGTDLYKQEIVHYILVHSPDQSHQFRNLKNIQTDGHGSVYLRDEAVYWAPESTSIYLNVKIAEDPGPKTCHPPCNFYKEEGYCIHLRDTEYKVLSVWNHLVFAFHLPNHRGLEIKKEQLLNSLTACAIAESPLIDEYKRLEEKAAKDIIRKMKSDFGRQKRKRSSQALNGPAKTRRTQDPPPRCAYLR